MTNDFRNYSDSELATVLKLANHISENFDAQVLESEFVIDAGARNHDGDGDGDDDNGTESARQWAADRNSNKLHVRSRSKDDESPQAREIVASVKNWLKRTNRQK